MPRPEALRALLVLVLLAATVLPVSARIQGVKGRRIEVFADLEKYRGNAVVVALPELNVEPKKQRHKRQMLRRHVQWMTQEFLVTRLRELPWAVTPWYDELGALEPPEGGEPELLITGDLLLERKQLSLVLFLRDRYTGQVVARFQGYGKTGVRGAGAGARDDLQEITRVLTSYLAEELKVGQPGWWDYESQPFRRRDRSAVKVPMVEVDKDREQLRFSDR